MSESLIQVVDENDRPLRGGTMDEVQLDGLWHRIVGVMVHDSKRDLYLLQKIAPNPYYNSGKWNLTATGHVDEGETYLRAAKRELHEEMGIVGTDLLRGEYYTEDRHESRAGENRRYRRFYQIYKLDVDSRRIDVSPGANEVQDVSWFSGNELIAMSDQASSDMTSTLLRFINSLRSK